mgnify:CR=1 FL=1
MSKIIKGYYEGMKIKNSLSKVIFIQPTLFGDTIALNKTNLTNYEVITEDTVKNASSAILRGAVGTALLPGVGLLAGLSAKNKSTHMVAVEWKNGEKSLLELDQYDYKVLVKSMF